MLILLPDQTKAVDSKYRWAGVKGVVDGHKRTEGGQKQVCSKGLGEPR